MSFDRLSAKSSRVFMGFNYLFVKVKGCIKNRRLWHINKEDVLLLRPLN
jgi:hypothetical protein